MYNTHFLPLIALQCLLWLVSSTRFLTKCICSIFCHDVIHFIHLVPLFHLCRCLLASWLPRCSFIEMHMYKKSWGISIVCVNTPAVFTFIIRTKGKLSRAFLSARIREIYRSKRDLSSKIWLRQRRMLTCYLWRCTRSWCKRYACHHWNDSSRGTGAAVTTGVCTSSQYLRDEMSHTTKKHLHSFHNTYKIIFTSTYTYWQGRNGAMPWKMHQWLLPSLLTCTICSEVPCDHCPLSVRCLISYNRWMPQEDSTRAATP